MKTFLLTLAASGLLATATQAQTVTLGTDNRDQGVSQSNGHSFIRGDIRVGDTLGMYFGGRAETLEVLGADKEVSLYMGSTLGSFAGFALTGEVEHQWLVDAVPGSDNTEWEFTVAASRSFGRLDTKLEVSYTPDFYGFAGAGTWAEASVGTALTSKLYASAGWGHNQVRNGVDYDAWNVGASYALTPRMALDVRYYETNAPVTGFGAGNYGSQVVTTLKTTF